MPKIIKDLKPHIKEEALILFEEIGYEKVSMRKLATKVGIAVGTLYNYFPNKEDLYLEILTESWQSTLNDIKAVVAKPYDMDDLRALLMIIMRDIKDRKGLGKEVFQKHLSLKDIRHTDLEVKSVFVELFEIIEELVSVLGCKYPKRYAITLIPSIGNLLETFPDDQTGNIDYLTQL